MEAFTVKIIDMKTAAAQKELEKISARSKMEKKDVNDSVKAILKAVKEEGDRALIRFTERFDKVKLEKDALEVTPREIDAAKEALDPVLYEDLEAAAASVRRFHEAQLINTKKVELEDDCGSKVALIERPLERVGIYVPGGTAPLPSSVLMNAIPAAAAGVEEIIMCTPPGKDGKVADVILAAAAISGVDRIFRIGGAQAIAALAYGSESVPAVDMISGPGNIYVNTAKRLVFGQVAIDMFAGPSEILIIADETADPLFVARDMLSQAEHDVLASALLLTDSRELALAVQDELRRAAACADRRSILEASLRDYAAILLCEDLKEATELSNRFAPEHLEIMVRSEAEEETLAAVKNAGAIFLGPWSPEPLGDYYAGPNHTLPTSGTARFFSPLNVSQFRKKISLIQYKKESLEKVASRVERLAMSEGLDCHAAAVAVRRERFNE